MVKQRVFILTFLPCRFLADGEDATDDKLRQILYDQIQDDPAGFLLDARFERTDEFEEDEE